MACRTVWLPLISSPTATATISTFQKRRSRVAKASPEKRTPSIEQILHVLHAMPACSAIEKRNRALIAFILLTGVRDGAAASLKLKHVDLADGKVVQDAREERTEFSKTFTTWFFPVGEEVRRDRRRLDLLIAERDAVWSRRPAVPSDRSEPRN